MNHHQEDQTSEPKVDIILNLLKHPNKKDVALIKKAFEFSRKAHEGQKRMSGENYFSHPLETAKILAELRVDSKTLTAGLLHDTLEDAGAKNEEIEKNFGKEILFLVEGVTKLGKLKYRGVKRHRESMRKLFVAMSQDIRVIIIKLADRLGNMRTLEFLPADKQKRIAEETLEIYAPIANRLGIGKLRRELEDLSFRYVYPKEFKETQDLVKKRKQDTEKRLEKIRRTLQKELAKEKIEVKKTDYRLKGVFSLYNKLKRYEMDIEKIYDISALRVVVPEVSDCYRVLGVVHSIWRPLPGRIKDYIAFPKPNGYKSIHTTVFAGDGRIVEIQIRTEKMHEEAEFGLASHLSYKDLDFNKEHSGLLWIFKLIPFGKKIEGPENKVGDKNLINLSVPKWIKELAEYQAITKQEEMLDELKKDFFRERIFVFTPKGDVIDLPIDSTPIDFAYAVHSDIGNRTSGAKINNKMASLDTKLKNGDIVEIQTKQSSRPTEKWLKQTKTALAQKHIRSTLSLEKIKSGSLKQ